MAADDATADVAARTMRAIVSGELPPAELQTADDATLQQWRILAEIARIHRETLAAADPAASVGAPPPISVGRARDRWAHFYLIDRLGEGTSGIVYRAWDSRLAREVAVKLIVADRADAGVMIAEARRLARVRHPHVVTVYGVELVDGHVGIWMELLKGRTLHDFVRAGGPLSAAEAALVGADLCSALAAVHGAGLLHRDIKAHNVVREHGGRIVLMDLGAGREIEAATGDLAGTPLYLAPERFDGAPATVTGDLYSAGVLLFFLTTGALPVEAPTLANLKRAHARGEARALRDVRPDLPREFVSIVDRALSRDPARRFQSAGDMEAALVGTVSSRRVTAPPASFAWQVLARRLPIWIVMLLVAVAMGAAAAGGALVARRQRGSPQAAPAAVVVDGGAHVVAPDQLMVGRGFEALASSLGAAGKWDEAIAQYEAAERLYRLNTSPDAPIVARARMHVAWAQRRAGRFADAIANYELAVAKYRDFNVEPLIAATLTSLAAAHQARGEYDAAATALDGALEARAKTLGLDDAAADRGFGRIGRRLETAASLMRSLAIDRDSDGDWLPDLLEAVVGLDPDAADSDGDGLLDTHEDHDGDGIANDLELALPLDPTGVIVHYGSNNPEWLSFTQSDNRRVPGRPAASGAPAWEASAIGLCQYYLTLTAEQRRAAVERGWRMTTSGVHHAGRAYANVDLAPAGPRFDLDIEAAADGGLILQRNTSVVPYQGITNRISTTSAWTVVELEYDPARRSADLFVGGRQLGTTSYAGHPQFQENLGVFFGTFHPASDPTPGRADFNLVMFTIR